MVSAEKKNPHESNSPEWQLWENWNAADALIRSADDDVRRAEMRRAEAVIRKEKYGNALAKLGHPT